MWESTTTMPMRMTKITAGWGTLLPTRSTTSRAFCMPVFGAATAAGAALMRPSFPGGQVVIGPSANRSSEGPEDRNEERGHQEVPHEQRQPQLPVVTESISSRSHHHEIHRGG